MSLKNSQGVENFFFEGVGSVLLIDIYAKTGVVQKENLLFCDVTLHSVPLKH